jgi:L-fuconolactonase
VARPDRRTTVARRCSAIDSHQHFWRIDRGDYGWLTPELAPIYRDFGPGDLQPILARHGIAHTILVQAAPTIEETRYLLALAEATPYVVGVVGWVDFDARDAPETIARLAADPLLVGLRPMVHDIADEQWVARPELSPVFEAMIAHGLVFDALVRPRHLPALQRVLARHPALAVVVDHAAKPQVGDSRNDAWLRDLAEIAACPQVVCKLSGLVTEAPRGCTVGTLRPFVDALIALFGTRRLLWGSDWPVVELGGGYDHWRALTLELLAGLDSIARADVLGANAARVYL